MSTTQRPLSNYMPASICVEGAGIAIVFCGGFKSNMHGSKAQAIERWCQQRSWAFCRFDYQGHGQSAGKFEEGNISVWLQDTLSVLDSIKNEKILLIGSSMGAWIAQLACIKRPQRVAGLLLLASATDFTRDLIQARLSLEQQAELEATGRILVPSDYDDGSPYPITQQLLQDGNNHLLLGKPIPILCPVRLIHGTKDSDVAWQTSQKTLDSLQSADVQLLLIKNAGHRLSTPPELALIEKVLVELHSTLSKQIII